MTSFERVSAKLYIPHPSEPNCSIVGVLEQISSTIPGYQTGSEKKIALVRTITLLLARYPVSEHTCPYGYVQVDSSWNWRVSTHNLILPNAVSEISFD
jgi:hypothetical protein